MTKGNAQNNTDWGNEEYDNLIKEANGSLLREPDKRNEALQKLKVFYSRRTSCTYISKR